MVRSDRLLQRGVAIAVVTIDFEFLQINRQLAKRKWSHAARCEIEPRTALRLGPMHVIGMLVSHTALGKFCCPRTTRINTNRKRLSHEALLECGASSHRFSSSAALDPKRHEEVSHSESFAKLRRNSFRFAFICVFCGLKTSSKNNKLAARQGDGFHRATVISS